MGSLAILGIWGNSAMGGDLMGDELALAPVFLLTVMV